MCAFACGWTEVAMVSGITGLTQCSYGTGEGWIGGWGGAAVGDVCKQQGWSGLYMSV